MCKFISYLDGEMLYPNFKCISFIWVVNICTLELNLYLDGKIVCPSRMVHEIQGSMFSTCTVWASACMCQLPLVLRSSHQMVNSTQVQSLRDMLLPGAQCLGSTSTNCAMPTT